MSDFDENLWIDRLTLATEPDEFNHIVDEILQEQLESQKRLVETCTNKLTSTLPMDVLPQTLQDQFFRIFKRIALLWAYPKYCDAYLESLIVDERGDRAGFPFSIISELTDLRAYYHASHPELFSRSTWSALEFTTKQ